MGAFGNPNLFPRDYFPKNGLNPIHDVENWAYARKIARDAMRGDDITPILYDGFPNNGNLLAGTHRSAANEILDFMGKGNHKIPKVSLDDVMALPEDYGLTKVQAKKLRRAVIDGEYDVIDDIWDRR